MVTAIQNAVRGMGTASEGVEAISLRVLRTALDTQQDISQQMVNMVADARVYDANAKMVKTAEKMLDIVV